MASKSSWKIESLDKKSSRMEKTLSLDLPYEILQMVMSRLSLKDNIRASTVCKTWNQVCVSVRVEDKSPWLIYFSKTEESYEFHDTSSQKTYKLEFPELSGFRVCYSKDSWLLMYNANSSRLVFFNPFTRDRIPVPSLFMAYDQRMAFSCAPTSTSCVLFTVTPVDFNCITVKTCCPNAQEWKEFVFKNQSLGYYTTFKQIVFSNGVFYCLRSNGCLSIFDPALSSWNVLPALTLKDFRSNGCFMTEYHGEIFVIYMYDHTKPVVLKLDQKNWSWTERKTLGGLTIYTSALSSVTRTEQESIGIRNSLCLSVYLGFQRTCMYYKVDEESVISISLKWQKRDPYENIWIEPPVNLLGSPFV